MDPELSINKHSGPDVFISENSVVESWVTGKEAWFTAFDVGISIGIYGLGAIPGVGWTLAIGAVILTEVFDDKIEENLERVYNAYFENTSAELYDAFNDISNAIKYLPPSVEEQYGPSRIGTSYPLCLITGIKPPRLNSVNSDNFYPARYGQFEDDMGLGFSDIGIPYGLRHKTELKMLKEMIRLLKSGIKKLKALPNKNKELLSVINVVEYILYSNITLLNVKLFYEQRVSLKLCDSPTKMLEICAKIRKIGLAEIENAKKSIKCLRKDSRLGYEASMGYVGDENRVNWKIKQVNYMIEREIPYYEDNVKKSMARNYK